MVSVDDLDRLIAQGEGPTSEFKSGVPKPEHLARVIAAFANAQGGTILLGVRDDGTVQPVSEFDANKALERALTLLKPEPEAILTRYPKLTGVVARIDVAPDPRGPIISPDGVFTRSDNRIEPLPGTAITAKMARLTPDDVGRAVAPLAQAVESATARVVDLEKRLVSALSWKRRLPDMLLGALISALFGVVLALLLRM